MSLARSMAALLVIGIGAECAANDEREAAWLSRGNRIAFLVTSTDPFRGFDRVDLEIRSLDRAGRRSRVLTRTALLSADQLLRYSRGGQYELYRADLQIAREAASERLQRAGYRPLRDLAVTSGVFELFDAVLSAEVRGGVSSLVEPLSKRRVIVGSMADSVVELSHERIVRLSADHVFLVQLTADGRWLLATVRTNVPNAAEVEPLQRVLAVPLKRVMRRLRIQPPSGDPS